MIAAADRLRVSQPLLSKHLQLLEREVGAPLFYLEGRKKRPTAQGQEFYKIVKRSLATLEEDLRRFDIHLADASRVEVRIGGRREILDSLPSGIKFAGRLVFVPMSGREVVAALRERRLDIGITQYEIDSHELVRKKWFEDRFHLAAPEAWLNSRSGFEAGLKKLASRPRLSYGNSDVAQEFGALFPDGRAPEPFRVDPSWTRIVNMVEQKIGWSIVPDLFLTRTSKIASIPVPAEVKSPVTFHLLYSKELAKLNWFRALLTQLRS
jgi:DNA-binding transcriptional LysR family regulator